MKHIKNLSLRFLNLLTSETLKAIFENFKGLEGLDISGCFGMDLNGLSKLRGNNNLKCLLLEYLILKTENLKHLLDSKVSTLSVFCKYRARFIYEFSIDSKNFNETHLETLKEMKTLTNLNMLDCPMVTEPRKYIRLITH